METTSVVGRPVSRPLYLDLIVKWKFPDLHGRRSLEDLGPSSVQTFNFTTRLHPRLLKDALSRLHRRKLVSRCLNLNDGHQIIARWESCKWLYRSIGLWGSVGRDAGGNWFLPRLQVIRGQTPIVYWIWLQYPYSPDSTTILINC